MVQLRPHIAIFGAGIAGLSAADALVRAGYQVSIYEKLGEPGGFFRSFRQPDKGNLPSEYSWHGMGPWYHNVYDLLKQIPFDAEGSIYDRGLSRPIDFGIFPNEGKAQFYDRRLFSLLRMFRLKKWEFLKAAWLMIKTWSAHHRSERSYSRKNAAAAWRDCLSVTGYRTWRSCFGPWIGSDWTNVSLHTAGQFFRKQLTCYPSHLHAADAEGPAWSHGAGDGWLLLRGPSSEVWFDKWIANLANLGVTFHWNVPLEQLNYDGTVVTSANCVTGTVSADYYILATNPFAARDVLAKTPSLESQPELSLFRPLVEHGPHVQVSFRIGFSEEVHFPRLRTAVVVTDSPFNLTLFAQEQAWSHQVNLGAGVRSLWTGTSCVSTVPGRLFGLPVKHCTKEQFIREVETQILACESLQQMIRDANAGRDLGSFAIIAIEVWHEWQFSRSGIRGGQPKWVNATHTQPFQPHQITPVPNLLLAGAHTLTEADVWSIEAAVESGRRAAQAIEPSVKVIAQHQPALLKTLGKIDNLCYKIGLPHVLDIVLFVTMGLMSAGIVLYLLMLFE